MKAEEIAQALENRVDAILNARGNAGCSDPEVLALVLALIQALAELMGDDEDGLTAEKGGE